MAEFGAQAMAQSMALHARTEHHIYSLLTPKQQARVRQMKQHSKTAARIAIDRAGAAL